MIAREFDYLLAAVQFLTRLPVSQRPNFQADWIDRSTKYFPLVGGLVGLLAASVVLATSIVLPQPLPMILGLIAGIMINGALHEDGLADTADGLFGGTTRERRLEIMKDSRVGSYGVLALGAVLALKLASLHALDPWMAAAALVGAHSGGRLIAVFALRTMIYVGDTDAAKIKPPKTPISTGELVIASAFAIVPMLIGLAPSTVAICFALGALLAAWIAWTAHRAIGGYTGDVIGAMEQMFEVGFLIAAAALISGPG
jgi:adenosylcobinamide-GDP ribazoletransferase